MLEQKQYGIVMRHLGGRQQGIQGWHAANVYAYKYHNTKEWQRYASKDHTIILKEAGTTEQLEKAYRKLKRFGIKVAKFYEPDFSNAFTGIVFLLDERYWDEGKYPDPDSDIMVIREFVKKFPLASG